VRQFGRWGVLAGVWPPFFQSAFGLAIAEFPPSSARSFSDSMLRVSLCDPPADFMPVEAENAANLEKWKVPVAEQFVNRAVRNLQILSQVLNCHKLRGARVYRETLPRTFSNRVCD